MSSLEDITQEFVAIKSAAIGQEIPQLPKSYLYVDAKAQAGIKFSVDKKAELATRENLATTASIGRLTEIGREVLLREPFSASPARITADYVVTPGVVIPSGTVFVSDENGLSYSSEYPITGDPSGTTGIVMLCESAGEEGTVSVGSKMTLQTPTPGIGFPEGTVSLINNEGLPDEGTEDYRSKILDKQFSQGGGGNLADYRDWAQGVQGVHRAYPYSGQFDSNGNNIGGPSSRTVFIRAIQTGNNPSGIPSPGLLDEVLAALITNPETGVNRIPAGVPDSTLYVESIYFVTFNVSVFGSSIEWPAELPGLIEDALEEYFDTLKPSIEGLDPVNGRTNEITEISLGSVVQGVTIQYGVNASSVSFINVATGESPEKYVLPAGGLPKLSQVLFP